MTLVLILSSVLIALIIIVEGINFRRTRRITFLTAAHVLIAIGYCLPPFLILLLPETSWDRTSNSGIDPNPWGIRLYLLDLAEYLRLPRGAYIEKGIILLGAYAVMLAGYFLGAKIAPRPMASRLIPAHGAAGVGLALGAVTIAAIVIYASQFLNLEHFLTMGRHIRSGNYSARWGYLQVLTQIGFPAFLLLVAAAIGAPKPWRAVLIVFAAIIWLATVARLMHVGGRLEFGGFILTPILAVLFLAQSKRLASLIAVGAVLAALVIANFPHDFGLGPLHAVASTLANILSDIGRHVLFVVSEFGFPHIAAAHTLTVAPDQIPFRYFVDIPLGLLYMLPNFSGIETLPPMILSLHVQLLPWIPVDMFSFGYYSLGTVGVLLVFAAFGVILALFDGWLTESTGWLGQALRAAWLFYLPFRLFYTDPYATLQSGFGLITGTVIITGLTWVVKYQTRTR
ncbi:MAG: hypothetical protein RIA64_13045 [Rhodospirillales bacterium]